MHDRLYGAVELCAARLPRRWPVLPGAACAGTVCACAPGAFGEDCELDVCQEHRAFHRGVQVELFDHTGFNVRAGATVWQDINFDSSSIYPGMARGLNSFIFTGHVRILETGYYRFRSVDGSQNGLGFVNGTLVTEGTVLFLNKSSNYYLRLEVENESYYTYPSISFQWAGPYVTQSDAATASASDFSPVPANNFLFETVCPNGCSGHGCCVADSVCSCDAGWGGHNCAMELATCGQEAPSGEVSVGGIRAHYYSDTDFKTVVVEQLDERVYLPRKKREEKRRRGGE